MVECASGIAATAHAGDHVIRQLRTLLLLQLLPYLGANYGLEAGHHVRVWVRPYYRANDVMRIFGVVDPVADGFVGGVFEGFAARDGRYHGGPQQLHPLHVGLLPLHVHLAHVHDALQVGQGADGGGGHAVLPGAGLGDNTLLP